MSNDMTLAREALQHRISNLPDSLVGHIKMGFRMLARLSDDNRNNFLSFIVESIANNLEIESKKASSIAELDDNTVHDPITATTFVVGVISDLDVTTDDFFASIGDRFFESGEKHIAEQVVGQIFKAKTNLEIAINKGELVNSILPSLRKLNYKIDIRTSFKENGDLDVAAPVAVFHLTTDCDDDVWFQASSEKLEWLAARIEEAKADASRAALLVSKL